RLLHATEANTCRTQGGPDFFASLGNRTPRQPQTTSVFAAADSFHHPCAKLSHKLLLVCESCYSITIHVRMLIHFINNFCWEDVLYNSEPLRLPICKQRFAKALRFLDGIREIFAFGKSKLSNRLTKDLNFIRLFKANSSVKKPGTCPT